MNYLKAIALLEKPFIQWDLWANSLEELKYLGEDKNPLILPENLIPDYEYGVCPLKIAGGELVRRSGEDMDAYKAEYEAGNIQAAYAQKGRDFNTATFEVRGKNYPMHEVARLYYGCIARSKGNYKVMSTTGIIDILTEENDAFLQAYYNKIKTLTQP